MTINVMPYEIKNLVVNSFKPNFDIECCLNIEEAITLPKKNFRGEKYLFVVHYIFRGKF